MTADVLVQEWATSYGLQDPTPLTHEVLCADPGRLEDVALLCRRVYAISHDAMWWAQQASQCMAEGWSDQAAAVRASDLMLGCDALAERCSTAADVIGRVAGAARDAQARIRNAYGVVERRVEIEPQLTIWALCLLNVNIRRECTELTSMVLGAASACSAQLDRAATEARESLSDDPRALIVDPLPARSATAPPNSAEALDAALRERLHQDILHGTPQQLELALGVRRALLSAEAQGAPVQLLEYDPDNPPGQGSASIAVGDVAQADNVAVVVPGVGNSPSAMDGILGQANKLREAADDKDPNQSTAVVVWLGYDIPLSVLHDPDASGTMANAILTEEDFARALDDTEATIAGQQLADFCSSLRGLMSDTSGLTLVGQSYGGTVASQAAKRMEPGTLAAVLMAAAPGAGKGVDSAADYTAVPPENVWTLAYPHDPIAQPVTDQLAALPKSLVAAMAGPLNPIGPLGPVGVSALVGSLAGPHHPFGADPTSPDFGGRHIDAQSPTPATGTLTGDVKTQHPLHNYLSGEGLDAVASIITGQYSDVPTLPPR